MARTESKVLRLLVKFLSGNFPSFLLSSFGTSSVALLPSQTRFCVFGVGAACKAHLKKKWKNIIEQGQAEVSTTAGVTEGLLSINESVGGIPIQKERKLQLSEMLAPWVWMGHYRHRSIVLLSLSLYWWTDNRPLHTYKRCRPAPFPQGLRGHYLPKVLI